MILSKHMQPKQDGRQPSIAVTLNVHVIKRKSRTRKFITMEAQLIKVVNGGSISNPQRLKLLPSSKSRMLVKIFKSQHSTTMFQWLCPKLNANIQRPATPLRNSSWCRGRVGVINRKKVSNHYGLFAHCTRGMELYLARLYVIFFKINFTATKMLPKFMCKIWRGGRRQWFQLSRVSITTNNFPVRLTLHS